MPLEMWSEGGHSSKYLMHVTINVVFLMVIVLHAMIVAEFQMVTVTLVTELVVHATMISHV